MKLNIKSRLNLGFASAIFLVLLIGVISYATFRQQNYEAGRVKHSYMVINQLADLQNLLIEMETGRRGFRSTNEKRFLEPYRIALGKFEPALAQSYLLLQDNQSQVIRLRKLEKSIRELMAFWRDLGEDASGYTRQIIISINEREKKRMDLIRNQVEAMNDIELHLLSQREAANVRSVNMATTGLIIGISLILLIVAVLIYLILYEFNNRTRAENELKYKNDALSTLNNESAEKNWLLAGLAEINESLQGINSTNQLCEKLLSRFVRYFNADAAAIYLYNEDDSKLDLSASVALSKPVKNSFDINEGLIGRAATEKEPIHIKQIPAQALKVETALMQTGIAEALYISLYLNDELKGVVELLTLKTFNEHHINLLQLVNNNVSVAIHSAQSREKVLLLLEKVQQQKEELENQQEELRQANEELSVQTEVLQSSEEELRVQEEELRQINAELEEKNNTIETARQALILKATELETTNKYKSEFLANMSHELRTPLNSVLILAKLLADNAPGNLSQKQIEHARIIHKSGSDLLQLINDILDLSKIEAGKVDIDFEEVAIATIASDLEQVFQPLANEKNIEFSIDIDEALPGTITTDLQKIEQVIKNLLSNAIKFTPVSGRVKLLFLKSERHIKIEVSDTGIGINEKQQKIIFEAFKQADGSTSRKYGGTGLGLSITKELVKLLGGSIQVKSNIGSGSLFVVELPIIAKSAVEKLPAAEVSETGVEKEDLFLADQQTIIRDDRNDLQTGDKIILIIEDDVAFASMLRDVSKEQGYKVLVAIKGDEGIFYAKKYLPHAIILDMQLPVLDGRQILRLLKNDKELRHIPVHILSAADEHTVEQGHALAFLKKPVQKKEIEEALTFIGEYLQSNLKKVLLVAGKHLETSEIQQWFDERHFEVNCDMAPNIETGMQMIAAQNYDCIIADIGDNVEEGSIHLNVLHDQLKEKKTPLIVYLDQDITPADEMKLKKISEVVVRKSSGSYNRLMDEIELFLYKINESKTPVFARHAPTEMFTERDLQNKKILLVDDDMRNVFALTAALEKEEINVITAADGKDALENLQKHEGIDLVLMDIMMPEMDGYEAIRYIRNDMKLTRLPIIALTAKAMIGDREKCLQAGASDYITKPVDIQKLVSLMRVWLS